MNMYFEKIKFFKCELSTKLGKLQYLKVGIFISIFLHIGYSKLLTLSRLKTYATSFKMF